jgi:hypothetical protein
MDNFVPPKAKAPTDIKFGQEKPTKGAQNVFSVILKDIDNMMDGGAIFGHTKEGLSKLREYVAAREAHGVKKYGTSLETWNGRDPLTDAIEEEVDRLDYLVQARIERADLIELVNDLKRKNNKLEKALDEANHAIAAFQRAAPTQAMGAALEAPHNVTVAPGDPVQLPHAAAHRAALCTTGLVPDARWPDTSDVLRDLFLACYANSALHGFWGDDAEQDIKRTMISGKEFTCIPEKLVLMHSELSEALEVYRDKDNMAVNRWLYFEDVSKKPAKPEGFVAELADVFIRLGDTLGAFHLEQMFVDAVRKKMAYNATRPRMHGKKI